MLPPLEQMQRRSLTITLVVLTTLYAFDIEGCCELEVFILTVA